MSNLHAALNVALRKVIAALADRYRQREHIEFLGLVDRRTSTKKVLHSIVNNASTHNTNAVHRFLGERPGLFMVHYRAND